MSQSVLSDTAKSLTPDQKPDDSLAHAWFGHLLQVLDGTLSEETKKAVLKECSFIHYRAIQMEELVSQYRGNLPGFIEVLEQKWQWNVAYDPAEQVIIADENKPTCVCPIVQLGGSSVSKILCHCSEGFAERMFAGVVGKPVEAQVEKSILRGDASCVYRIKILSCGYGTRS